MTSAILIICGIIFVLILFAFAYFSYRLNYEKKASANARAGEKTANENAENTQDYFETEKKKEKIKDDTEDLKNDNPIVDPASAASGLNKLPK